MKQVIVIPTCPKYWIWLKDFLKSYNHKYPIVLVYGNDNQYDAKAVIHGIEAGYDEFLVLHDTIEIKDNSFFDIVFEQYKGKSVQLVPVNTMFMYKYRKEDLDKVFKGNMDNLMAIDDKESAVMQELHFSKAYNEVCNPIILFTDLDKQGNNIHLDKYGRDNEVLENEYLIKYKGSWNLETLEKAHKYVPK